MSGPRIRVENLVKRYRRYAGGRPRTWKSLLGGARWRRGSVERFTVLNGVGFELGAGESLGIIGRNGAGKSTLLRLVGGVGLPDEGLIEVNGRIGSLLELGTGMHPDLSGRDNALLGCMVGGLSRREAERRLPDIAGFAELEEFMAAPMRSYSTGMQMRLGFAVSIHMDPEVLLVDEVLSVGDLPFQRKCLKRIEALQNEGCALLFATHDLAQAEESCERLLWLERGEPVALGEPGEVVAAYREAMDQVTRKVTPPPDTDRAPQQGQGAAGLVLGQNRLGSQEMRILDVALCEPGDVPTATVQAGDPLLVRVRYAADSPVDHPIVGVSLSDESGRVCLEVSTAGGAGLGNVVRGRGEVLLELYRVDLRTGAYFVDVGLYERNWEYAYDYHWHAYPLAVTPRDRANPGRRDAPHRWSVRKLDEEAAEG